MVLACGCVNPEITKVEEVPTLSSRWRITNFHGYDSFNDKVRDEEAWLDT